MKRLCLGIIAVIGLTLSAFAQEAVKAINPEGIYQLNLAKSTIRGAYNKSETLIYTTDGLTALGFDFNSKPFTAVLPIFGEGKSHPLNSPDYDAVIFTQVDPYTLNLSRTRAGKVVETGTRIVNPDGKSMGVTRLGTDAAGRSYSHLLVYEKQ
jgi:hypothetical protein